MSARRVSDVNYVQIAGNVKTGTSLMSALLDGHPEVVGYPGETGVTGYLFPMLSDPGVSRDAKIERICRVRFREDQQPAFPDRFGWDELEQAFRALAASIENDPFELHEALLRASCEVLQPHTLERASTWVDKSPFAHRFADEIFEAYPSTRFLHMIRDPKDNYASIASKLQARRARPRRRMERILYRYRIWSAQSLWFARRNRDKYGDDRYRVIRYEDLCRAPRETLQEICRFLGIDEAESLYTPTRAGRPYGGNNFEGKTFRGINAGSIGGWDRRMPAYYAQVMECQPRELLEASGYELVFSPRQRAAALLRHRLRTRFVRRGKLLGTKFWPERIFETPEPGVPGIRKAS